MEEGALLSPIALGVFVCGGLARFHLAGNGVDGCIPAHRHVGTAAQASLGKVPFQTAAQVSGTGADRVQPLDDIALSVEGADEVSDEPADDVPAQETGAPVSA